MFLQNSFNSVARNSSQAIIQEMQLLEIFLVKFHPLELSRNYKKKKLLSHFFFKMNKYLAREF